MIGCLLGSVGCWIAPVLLYIFILVAKSLLLSWLLLAHNQIFNSLRLCIHLANSGLVLCVCDRSPGRPHTLPLLLHTLWGTGRRAQRCRRYWECGVCCANTRSCKHRPSFISCDPFQSHMYIIHWSVHICPNFRLVIYQIRAPRPKSANLIRIDRCYSYSTIKCQFRA